MPRSGVSGDFSGLAKWIATMERLAKTGAGHGVKVAIGEAALTRLRLNFRRGVDPYDRPWKDLAIRNGRPLRDTGGLANSFTYEITTEGVSIGSSKDYAGTHQDGAEIKPVNGAYLHFKVGRGRNARWFRLKSAKIPARKMVPDEGDLGNWQPAIVDAGFKAMRKEITK